MDSRDSRHNRSVPLPGRLTYRTQRSKIQGTRDSAPQPARPEFYSQRGQYSPHAGRRSISSDDRYGQDYASVRETLPGPNRRLAHDPGPLPDKDLDDVTSESEISDAVSANEFTFDGPDVDAGETRTQNTSTATTFGGRDIVTSLTSKKTDKPSPYIASSLTVLSSRFIGDVVLDGHWTADLSIVASDSPFQPRKQPLFRWIHLQGEPNFSSFIATLEETRRGIIEVNTVGPIDSANHAAPAFQVSDKSNRTWLIPLAQCSTWLDFVANFSTLTDDFEADYYVIYCKVIQHPEDWQNLVENARKQTLLHLAIHPRR
ncbi:MAG: hypothetical protein Q9204_005844 [Flavoplaca sp. TL-2023a]